MEHEVSSPSDLRARLEQAVALTDKNAVIAAACELHEVIGGARATPILCAVLTKANRHTIGLRRSKVALLSSFSIDLIHDALTANGLLEGLDIEIYQAGFGQFRQELLTEGSNLYRFRPDVAILAVEAESWMPRLFNSYLDTPTEDHEAEVRRALDEIVGLAKKFTSNSEGLLIVHSADGPTCPALGLLDGKPAVGQHEFVMRFNVGLYEELRRIPNVHLLNYQEVVAEIGRERWYDPRMAHYARAPVAQAGLQRLASVYAHFLSAHAGGTRKCLVLDLDNTIWGGVVGEDGIEGIRLGPDYPGSAYVEFQTAVSVLVKRGVLLAIASKNNPDDVWDVFDRHPHMVLRRDDIAAAGIGWDAKSESVREIASTLGIGLEHIVFVDDNPAECAQVKKSLPEVTVVKLPRSPERFVRALLGRGLFDGLSYSAEDRCRTALYQKRQHAQTLQQRTDSLEDYLRELGMTVYVAPLSDGSVARAAQMTQKTNQFNATTTRYTEGEIIDRAGTDEWVVLSVRVTDRFGDHGIVGLVMAEVICSDLKIDTFLLSCRIIGRTIETAMLGVLCDLARRRNLRALIGRIVPTGKNAPIRDLFARHGFELIEEAIDLHSVWRLDVVNSEPIEIPEWLVVDYKV